MPMFSNKKTWFSYFVRQSPVVVRFRGDVTDSKYDLGTNEDTGYQYRMRWFDTRDDSPDGTYLVIESERMEELVSEIPSNVWVELEAGRDGEQATLEYSSIEGRERPVKSREQGGQGYHTYPSLSARYTACLDASEAIAQERGIDKEDTPEIYWEFVRNVATHFSMSLPSEFGEPLVYEDPAEDEALDEAEDDVSDVKGRIADLVEEIDDWTGEAHDGNSLPEMLDRISNARANVTDRNTLNEIRVWLEKESESQREIGGEEELPF